MAADVEWIALKDVRKTYPGTAEGQRLVILSGASLQIRRGEAVAIVGPSGSGKTTLLNLIGTLDQPDGGKVILGGQDLSGLSERELANVRNRKVGFVFQAHHLLPHLSVIENVLVPTLALADAALKSDGPARARRLLVRVGLEGRMHHRPSMLSGGERQRAAVVRALINRPEVLLADEPTGALDQASARELGRLLRELNLEEAVTLVVVTHSVELAEGMDRILEFGNGVLRERLKLDRSSQSGGQA